MYKIKMCRGRGFTLTRKTKEGKKKRMKKQKGITMVALVITIILMLILAGVSVTVALNGGLFSTTKGAVDGAQIQSEKQQLVEATIIALDDKGIVNFEKLNKYLETDFDIKNGKYTSKKTGIIYVVSEKGDITEKEKVKIEAENYNKGTRITINNEGFYVIANDADTVTVLAEYCIITEAGEDYLKQSPDAGTIAFSDTNYWLNADSSAYPLDLNDLDTYPIPEEKTSIITIAKEYGEKFETEGITGRLMNLEDVESLEGNRITQLTSDCPEFINKIDNQDMQYWLSSANNSNMIWVVYGKRKQLLKFYYLIDGIGEEGVGLRPVLEISKAAI